MNEDASSLDRLHDIIGPNNNLWWPLAPGWYWLIALGLLLLAYFLMRSIISWRHNAYRREALAELSHCEGLLVDHSQRPQLLHRIACLLKRTAITAYPRTKVARLTGQPWFTFLDSSSNRKLFVGGNGELLERAVYDSSACAQLSQYQINELVQSTRQWIASHDRDFERAGQSS